KQLIECITWFNYLVFLSCFFLFLSICTYAQQAHTKRQTNTHVHLCLSTHTHTHAYCTYTHCKGTAGLQLLERPLCLQMKYAAERMQGHKSSSCTQHQQ